MFDTDFLQAIQEMLQIDESSITRNDQNVEINQEMLVGANSRFQFLLKLHPTHCIFNASRQYDYRFDDKKRIMFNQAAQTQYQGYSISGDPSGGGVKIVITRRLTRPSHDMVITEITDFYDITKKLIPDFERKVIDFDHPSKEEEEYDPEVKFEQPVEETDSQEFMDKYKVEQQEYVLSVFHKLAKGSDLKEDNGTLCFVKKSPTNTLLFSHTIGDPDIVAAMEMHGVSEEDSYMLLSHAMNNCRSDASYENNIFCLKAYIVPDQYDPSGVKDEIGSLCKEMEECKSVLSVKAEPDILASNMQKLMDDQMEALKIKEEEIEKRFLEMQEREKQFEEKENLFNEQTRQLEQKMKEKETELADLKEEIDRREVLLKEAEDSLDGEKAKYLLNIKNLTAEIARLQTRTGSDNGRSDSEVRRLEIRIEQLTKSKAVMERTLKAEIEHMNARNRELTNTVHEKELEISDLQSFREEQSAHLFDNERAEYEQEIEKLKEIANITGEEVTLESFEQYAASLGVFSSIEIKHAQEHNIVFMKYSDKVQVAIVFGEPFFADVSKKMKSVNQKDLLKMNRETPHVKFFDKDGKVTARKGLSYKATTKQVYADVLDMVTYFE